MYDRKFMEHAVGIAKQGIREGCGGPFGCVIVKDGNIVAMAHNTVVKDNDPTAHGEINAIRQASETLGTFNLEGCELYTTSEPCPMCLSAIMWARISKVYSCMTIVDATKIGFDDSPFYEAITDYSVEGGCRLVEVEFHKEDSGIKLFNDYDEMEKILY